MSIKGGPQISQEEREQARERERERRREEQDEQTARSMAQGQAQQRGAAEPGYWGVMADPDVDHELWDDNLEAFVKERLSRAFALGNITRSEYKDIKLRIENGFHEVQNEMHGEGSELEADDMRMMYGGERPHLTDAKARRLKGAMEVAKQQASLSVDARGHKGGTEIHAVAETIDSDEEEEGGLFSSIGSYLGR